MLFAEFAYNNALPATTGKSLFQDIFGEPICWEDLILEEKDKNTPAAHWQAVNITLMRKRFEVRWQALVNTQVRYYNKKHKPMTYKVGNKVYLNSKNIKLTWPAKKLDYKYYRLYIISEAIEKQADKLELLPSIKIYNVFHVLLLEPYTGINESNNYLSPSIKVEKWEEYEVEEILDSCIYYNKL